MKEYRVIWECMNKGESFVQAETIEEAITKVKKGEDDELTLFDDYPDWTAVEIESEDGKEYIENINE